jgi:hypothetical protein
MTPREVEQLTAAEYEAFTKFADRDLKAQERATRKARARARRR